MKITPNLHTLSVCGKKELISKSKNAEGYTIIHMRMSEGTKGPNI